VCRLPSFLSYSRKVVHSSYVVGGYCRLWVFGTEVVEPARTWTRVVVVWFVMWVALCCVTGGQDQGQALPTQAPAAQPLPAYLDIQDVSTYIAATAYSVS